MADPRSNENTILAPSALANENKVTVGKEFFIKNAKHLLTIICFFIKYPAKLYLGYHKTHFEVLLRVMLAVRKGEPIEKQIKELEENIEKYGEESSLLVIEIRKVPPSPWSDMNCMLLVLLLPLLIKDQEFVKAYNANLDAYENLVQKALESSEACVDAGRQIESGTPPRIKELNEEIEKLSVSGNIGTIIKKSYIKRLEFVEFDLVSTIQERRSAVEGGVTYLRDCWHKVRIADRL